MKKYDFFVGKHARTILNGINTDVIIKDYEQVSEKERFLVTPIKGGDDVWVEKLLVLLEKTQEDVVTKIIYKNRAGAEAFGDKLAKAMVDNLNKTVREEGIPDIKVPSHIITKRYSSGVDWGQASVEALNRHTSDKKEIEYYLSQKDLEKRKISFVACEDEDNCGFFVEFKYPNCTFFFCKEHKMGFNIDLNTVPDTGVECKQHGKMERYNVLVEDNVCPVCEKNTLAILSVRVN